MKLRLFKQNPAKHTCASDRWSGNNGSGSTDDPSDGDNQIVLITTGVADLFVIANNNRVQVRKIINQYAASPAHSSRHI